MARLARFLTAAILLLLLLTLGFWALAIRALPGLAPALPGTSARDSLVSGGRQRSFEYYLPRSLPSRPALLLVLHGSGMTGSRMRQVTDGAFDVLAERAGFIAVYPDGWDRNWNDCRSKGGYEARRLGVDDVAFMRQLIDRFAERHGIDRQRVFAAGVSNGGQLAFRLGMEAPGLVGGIAAIAASVPASGTHTCRESGRPVAAMIINGTADPLNPYAGGEVALWGVLHRRGQVRSAEASARYWAALAGVSGPPREEPVPDRDPRDGTRAVRFTWSAPGGPEVVLISVIGGGHTLAQPRTTIPPLLGRTSHDFSAAAEIWHFLERAAPAAAGAGAGR